GALLAGGVLGMLALLTYDLALVFWPLMLALVLLRLWLLPGERKSLPILTIAGCLILPVVLYLAVRLAFVPRTFGKEAGKLPSLAIAIKDFVVYIAALLNPVDPVLANARFGLPFPSRDALRAMAVPAGAVTLLLAAGAGWLVRSKRWRLRFAHPEEAVSVGFVVAGLALSIGILVVTGRRPGEAYLYLSIVFLSLLAGCVLSRIGPGGTPRLVVNTIVALFLASEAAATIIRNEKVVECGNVAKRILSGVPCDRGSSGKPILFSEAPGEQATSLY